MQSHSFSRNFEHGVVCLDIEVMMSIAVPVPRAIWDVKHANWDSLRRDIERTIGKTFFDVRDPEGSVKRFYEALCGFCNTHIS